MGYNHPKKPPGTFSTKKEHDSQPIPRGIWPVAPEGPHHAPPTARSLQNLAFGCAGWRHDPACSGSFQQNMEVFKVDGTPVIIHF